MATKITVTNDDGSTTDFFPTAPPPSPKDTEVDVLMSDGTTKVFIPKE